jgi:putative endonuclease
MSNHERNVFYIGVSGHIAKRVYLHKTGRGGYFTSKYKCYYLVHFDKYDYVLDAIKREKQLKSWRREWKIQLIILNNPTMCDLAKDWDFSYYANGLDG